MMLKQALGPGLNIPEVTVTIPTGSDSILGPLATLFEPGTAISLNGYINIALPVASGVSGLCLPRA